MPRTELLRQRQLPLPWTLSRPLNRCGFAHPAEAQLAKILTFYRIRWLYEPTSFVLRTGPDGRPAESFTPDFYLPEQRLYIELTTMRQSLVTRKNRKLRRLRELYPGVQIKLLYRRDVEGLLHAYDEGWRAPVGARVGSVVVDAAAIEQRVSELADEISKSSGFLRSNPEAEHALTVIGLAPGALVFQQQLVSALRDRGLTVDTDRAALTKFHTVRGKQLVRLVSRPRQPLNGQDILVVADIVSTGLSLAYLVDWLRRHGARRVETCALFSRSSSRLIDLPVRFTGFEAPPEPLIGYGIGLRQGHRRLPYVGTLVTESVPDRSQAQSSRP
jgi:hypoxanthine phosphoribosyltransferase